MIPFRSYVDDFFPKSYSLLLELQRIYPKMDSFAKIMRCTPKFRWRRDPFIIDSGKQKWVVESTDWISATAVRNLYCQYLTTQEYSYDIVLNVCPVELVCNSGTSSGTIGAATETSTKNLPIYVLITNLRTILNHFVISFSYRLCFLWCISFPKHFIRIFTNINYINKFISTYLFWGKWPVMVLP